MEQLENRQLMAVNILSVTPSDGEINWALDTNLTIRFDTPVNKGQGVINVVQDTTGVLGIAVDVNSPNVTLSPAGDTVTIDLPQNLLANNSYTVRIDSGAFVDRSAVTTNGATLLTQNFDVQPLLPYFTQAGGDGTDYSRTPPLNYVFDNTNMPAGGVPEWSGWSMADKQSWIRQADQGRSFFTRGSGTIVVGDPDEYADGGAPQGGFDAAFLTRPISLTGVAANSVVLEFDSSFRPENAQVGLIEVKFDNNPWEQLLRLDPTNTSNQDPDAVGVVNVNVNERLVSGTNTGVSSNGRGNAPFRAVNNPANASSMQLRWNVAGTNTWWWALDNLQVKGNLTGVPFLGINDNTSWNLDVPKLTVALDKTSMSENGGTALGTVTRNGIPTLPLTVTLLSSDTTEATVPATVEIPAGAFSVTFPVTAVNDPIVDRTQTVNITASAPAFLDSIVAIDVLDDDGPKIATLNPPDNATGVDYQSNLTITFDAPIKLGSGLINIYRTNGNQLVAAIDVNDASKVSLVGGNALLINPPVNLNGLTDFYVLMDSGVVLDTSSTVTFGATLLQQNFDSLALGPFTSGSGGDGTDFTKTPPLGFSISGTSGVGNPDFDGWSFVDKTAWLATSGGGQRSGFSLGSGILAVADASLWGGAFPDQINTFLRTAPIDLSKLLEGSAVFEFDANYVSGLPRVGVVEVSYDGGSSWVRLAQFDNSDVASSHFTFSKTGVTGSGITRTGTNALNNPATGSMVFRISLQSALSGWLAVDNLKITGDVVGLPFPGITEPTVWNFTTAIAPTITVTIDRTSMSENGGTAVGTVTRNLSTSGSLLVNLSNSDGTAATIPSSVTIPDGAASITFPITAIDDAIIDGDQTTVITGTATDYFSVSASINVLDDEFPKVTSVTPADNTTGVNVTADLVVQFDQPVKKGNGFVHIIRTSDGKAAQSIDIRSANVTVTGSTVTINPPANLGGLTDYYVSFENGAILTAVNVVQRGARLLSQDFELIKLQPAVTETLGLTANGQDWSPNVPSGFAVDNTQMPQGGVPEWYGWTLANKDFWRTASEDQGRVNFNKGQGTIAVGETDEWEDLPQPNTNFNSFLTTAPIDLSNVAARSVVFEFDSSFRPEASGLAGNQVGKLDVSYDNGSSWANVFTYDFNNTGSAATAPNVDEHKVVRLNDAVTGNPSSGQMKFRFNVTGTNDWWWAVDNLVVTASTNGLPYPGIANTDAATWNFTTAVAPTLTLSGPATAIVENGGTATLTVTRNLDLDSELVVNLSSSDTSLATLPVPATVTIPAGQASATFTVTAVDDANADGLKIPTITASSDGFVSAAFNVSITDNEVVDVITTEIMYNPAGTEPRTEWIEVYNRGATNADLSGWSLDDEDTTNWGSLPAGTLLAPGQVGIIFNSFFGLITEASFRTAWSAVPPTALVVGTFWGNLDNAPSATGTLNENLVLQDAGKAVVDRFNFDDDGTVWPAGANGPSIYLIDTAANNDDGTNWRRSVAGSYNSSNATGSGFSTADVASPGFVLTGLYAGVTPAANGIAVRLSRPMITGNFNLYDQGATLGTPDVVLVGATTGEIRGSIVVDADSKGFTFVPTGPANSGLVNGLLPADTYTLTLRNAADAVVAVDGAQLLSRTGTPGDNVTTFTLTAPSASTVVVSIPDFARGFDQAVNVPNTSTGLPVLLSNGNDIGTVEFQVSYNPALLTISGFTSSVVGATVVTDFSTAGLAKVRVTSTTAFATSDGEFILGAFAATVPLTAPYGSKEVLRISGQSAATPRILRTDGSTVVPALADNAVHLAAFVGDLNGDETYNGVDAILMRRLIVGINSGSLSYQLADPVLFADLNVDGGVGGVDAVISQRLVVGSAGSIVPDLPSSAGTNTSTPGGPDPVIFVPTDLTASAGGTVVVPVRLRVTEAAGIDLTGVSLVMQFDATRFQLASANSISLSPLLTSSGFSQPSVNFSNGNGAIRFFASGATGLLPNGSIETLINVTLNVLPGATSGSSSFNIRANNASLGVGSGNQSTALNNADLATLVLNPAPTNGSADVGVDGVITVTGTSLANPTVVVTAPNAVYSGTAYVGASFTLTGTAAPTPTVSFTYYAGATATGTALAGAPINVGTYTVVASSAANAANNAATSAPVTFQITPKALTATATAGNKIYDGTTAATVAYTSLAGFVGTETVTVSGSGTFASKNAATGIAITATAPVLADGTNGGLAVNYSLPTPTGLTANITAKALTATATAGNKIYDGTTAATVAYTSLAGFIGTETVTVSGSGTFASKNAATGIAVTATAPVLADGTNGGLAVNYSLPTPTGLTANITAKALTATATAGNKIYDGTTAATVAYTSLAGFIGTETVTASGSGTFASKNAASGIAVTATTPVLADGTNGGLAVNYSLPTPTGLTANITAKALTATATAGNKIYDGTTAATVAYTSLAGFIGTETVTASGSGTFASKNAASGIAVTATTPVLADGTNGGLAVNYSLPTPTGLTANITAKALTATATAGNKIYDGTTAATVAYTSLAGFVGTETVTVSGSGTFASKNAASGIAVTATAPVLADGTNGGLAVNYSLPTPTGLTANITAKALTATATAGNKIYDGTTAATVAYTSLAGFVGTETVTVSGSGTFASKNAATGIAVTATAPVLADGTNGGLAVNYSLPTPTGLTANITAKALTVAADAKTKGVGAADPAFTFVATGLVPSETIATALSGSLTRDPGETAGTYTIRQGSLAAVNDNYAISFTTNTLTIAQAVTLSGSPLVNAGAAQRSQLTSLTVNFSAPVTLTAGAFSITNIGLTTPESTALAQSQILVNPSFGTAATTFTITFGAGAGVVARSLASGGNSLVDGNYRLDVDATKVVDAVGGNLAGATTFGAAATDNFFRLFGDVDGTGAVDANDLFAWRRATAAYNALFDANGDGAINSVDNDSWKPNYGKRRRAF